jgi:acyl-CoA thioester hydrolase
MDGFRFTTHIEVRYSDLDPQGHLNHARYLSFMEQARFKYIMALGLWPDVHDFNAVGQIVAEATCTYRRPVLLDQVVEVGVRVSRMGTKSMHMAYRMLVGDAEVATGRTVQVAYDYPAGRSIPIPAAWRAKVTAFEGGDDQYPC